jgi:UDP-N-acetylmuramoyl-tripeptide--D-alanyl-D-alanine ligase
VITRLKKYLYFPVASYFRFFAAIRLRHWNPKIIVVTGSNGKTTLLHLLESQIGEKAKYSHHANSSFGIPFDILGMHRKSLLKSEWISLILKTPVSAFKKPPKERFYVVEADCDRPREGKFLASLLKPSIVLWISTAKTHSMNFEHLVGQKFVSVDAAIAYEFGYFLQYAKELVLIDGDSELMVKQIGRTKARIVQVKKEKSLKSYDVSNKGTMFQIARDTRGTRETLDTFNFKFLLPEEVFYSIEMVKKVSEILNISFDHSFSKFIMPPGRGSIFAGIKNTTIIDSTYNANLSIETILSMFAKFSDKNKWVILSDMLELGAEEAIEHEKLAYTLNKLDFQRIILIGALSAKFIMPRLGKDKITVSYENTKDVIPYLKKSIKGGEVILFKGAQSFLLEGVIEKFLRNKEDVIKLPRRERIWEEKREKIGLN